MGYLLYDRCLHAARLHLLLQEDLLLRLLDDVLGPVGSAHHLQDLTWGTVTRTRTERLLKKSRGILHNVMHRLRGVCVRFTLAGDELLVRGDSCGQGQGCRGSCCTLEDRRRTC